MKRRNFLLSAGLIFSLSMNNEKEDLLGIIYKKYIDSNWQVDTHGMAYLEPSEYTRDEFFNKIRTDKKFAKKFKVEVIERDLTFDERYKMWMKTDKTWEEGGGNAYGKITGLDMMDEACVPNKLITITYNNQTEEIYE